MDRNHRFGGLELLAVGWGWSRVRTNPAAPDLAEALIRTMRFGFEKQQGRLGHCWLKGTRALEDCCLPFCVFRVVLEAAAS